jgi:uncharacterized RDD family membrane protein YckC
MMMVEDEFVSEVMSRIPAGSRRDQIEIDLRAHIAERMEHGQTIEQAISQFGNPSLLAESYLSSIPLVSASFMSRVVAKLIDLPGVLVAAGFVVYIAWQLTGPHDAPFFPGFTQNPVTLVICVITAIVMIPGYFIAAEHLTGKTLGKHVMGLHVVRESGARITLGQAFVRQIPLVGEFFFLDALFALVTDKKQRAFELISKTRTVRFED